MKIQCACGAKYAFDVTPEMAEQPVRFVCQNCGADYSEFVNGLIRQELGLAAPADAPPPSAPVAEVLLPPPPVPEAPPLPPPIFVATPRLRVASPAQPAGQTAETEAGSDAPQFCLKHKGEICMERCVVCQKPICPKCMELFGYVCSPLCKARAEAKKIKVPVYAGQKTVVEAQFWRKAGRISWAIAAMVAALLGFWFWYAWFGSVPHPIFSVRFTEKAYSGQSQLCGINQIVFLHGGTLARYDIKSKKEIWSRQLIDRQQIEDAVAREKAALQAAEARERGEAPGKTLPVPEEDAVQSAMRWAEAGLQLQVVGSNVWVSARGKLTQYDWNTGKVLQEVPYAGGFGDMASRGGELQTMAESENGRQLITHINLANGEVRTEEIGPLGTNAIVAARSAPGTTLMASTGGARGSPAAGLPLKPGADAGKPLDAGKVAEQAQRLPLPARIALPALLANTMHQERIMQEASDQSEYARSQSPSGALASRMADRVSLIPSKYGNLQFTVRLLEEKIVSREAMKAPPAKSTLNSGDLNVTRTADVANEVLNEMQRNRGGDTVEEDESRYQVTIHSPDSTEAADWTGEVVGPPALFSLKTVLWQASLAYSVPAGTGVMNFGGDFAGENSQYGEGPCVERGDTLLVFDQAMLTAFDLATGNVRWRLPSVGIAGLFFDDKGMLYVNSTTASPENIKYSRQIDISQKTDTVFLKVDPRTGKTLWSVQPGTPISYLSGNAVRWGDPGEEDNGMAALAGITPGSAYLRIRRISPSDGRILWDYQQERAPLFFQFHGNMIELVFKKEVQVLKFLSL
ncbi:MAG: PQQ-binding-like beta-propeller repeat protein [Verrucomicrobiota bacterium]